MKRGKLIVIDGTDGVGKATQTKLLVKRLRKEGILVETLDFPQYYRNFFGQFVGECQAGKYGDFVSLDPHIASVLYAADRFETKAKLEQWLADGKMVILDRYVSANQLHQGGKIKNHEKRQKFLRWLDVMEHKVFGLPRPDIIIYLHLPIHNVLRLLRNKNMANKKRYAGGKKDQVESNVSYLKNAQSSALDIIKEKSQWYQINCASHGSVLSRPEIHERVFTLIQKRLKLG